MTLRRMAAGTAFQPMKVHQLTPPGSHQQSARRYLSDAARAGFKITGEVWRILTVRAETDPALKAIRSAAAPPRHHKG